MKVFAPAGYAGFRCRAGACRHTCCAGWEIDIDPAALARYEALTGPFGEKLRESISRTAEGACFRTDAQGRCALLRADGLCELICRLGEDALCDICADHPRFRRVWADGEEIGLGLCCEEAAARLTAQDEPFRLVCIADDGGAETPDPQEEALRTLRAALFRLAQDRTKPLPARLADIAAAVGCEPPAPEALLPLLQTLESIEPDWQAALRGPRTERPWTVADEQFLCYLLFRHLPGALEDGLVRARILFALYFTALLRALPLERAEGFRLFSAEIEYSDENPGRILDEIAAQIGE